ncbi:glycosyl hydrolase family 47-domain-containing protein [Kalaharituber pfeilii]|nr:glycosyl hydrolase family 47-domain-containing protein [Kalaharituber pfeilii]
MFRLRRYRLVLAFTFIFGLAVYHFSLLNGADSYFETEDSLKPQKDGFDHNEHVKVTTIPLPKVAPIPSPHLPPTKTTPLPMDDLLIGEDRKSEPAAGPVPNPVHTPEEIHWIKQPEHYPVPPELIIKLPTGKPTHIPKIQTKFAPESESKRKIRLQRLEEVKSALKHSWKGYKDWAWGHDELAPISRGHTQKFGGWGATLIDALDTLWIMGLKKEFEEAIEFIEKLDFTTSNVIIIPVFETTIRYLGGLIGAYDVSEKKYPILLEKAKQLADVLYGVFDTPNRMPILYYNWHPDKVANVNQAPFNSGLAEMGTLALEFTRLAQLTGNHTYFDAIQRITDDLEAIQYNTSIPGMWPTVVDASGGCIPLPGPIGLQKREEEKEEKEKEKSIGAPEPTEDTISQMKCVPSHVQASSHMSSEYTLGGASDSFYEYLIKMHVLLGGTAPQYAKLYESSMKVAKEKLFFRPMLPGEPDILLSGMITVSEYFQNEEKFIPDTEHLGCFTGGMLALGAQVLKSKTDLEVGRKLTDGCVTLYAATKTGIMPEKAALVKCEDPKSCKYEEEKWLQALIPGAGFYPEGGRGEKPATTTDNETKDDEREAGGDGDDKGKAEKEGLKGFKTEVEAPEHEHKNVHEHIHANDRVDAVLRRRQQKSREGSTKGSTEKEIEEQSETQTEKSPEKPTETLPQKPKEKPIEKQTPLERARSYAKTSRLPEGFNWIEQKGYVLRPEAIESVFIMYRITGETAWQEKGWKMFQSVVNMTKTDIAFAAIKDVTVDPKDKELVQEDSMESFWLAETLKYFYLLFSEPEVISLDEWVFNTEAHPFKREKW